MKLSRMIFFLLVLAALALVPAVFAQTGGEQQNPGGTPTTEPAANATSAPANQGAVTAIRLDTPVTVTLSGTTPVDLSYKSNGNETISVTARSLEAEDVVDPTLTILDANGTQIASNDDHRTSRTDLAPHDSLVANLTLLDPGRYTIEVSDVNGTGGNVEILVTSGTEATPEANSVTNSDANTNQNQAIDDKVPANGAYTYNFQADAGEVLTITVRATDNQLDPKTSLVDSTGTVVASNDDHDSNDSSLGPYDSQIVNFAIPKTDTYTVTINGFAGIGGTFELTIDQGGTSNQGTPQPTVGPLPTEESSAQSVVTGTVNSNDVYTYNLDANAGDVYTITVQAKSDSLDPRVSVYLNNDYIIDNDDYGSTDPSMNSTDARIYNWIVASDGRYEIDVRGYEDTSGDFTMTIDHIATKAPLGLPTETVQLGTIKSGQTFSTTFDAQAGDWVTITARSLTTGLDPYIALMTADGTVLLDNDNSGSGSGDLAYFDAQIHNFHITDTGTYTVEVSGESNSIGQFGLTIGTLR